MLKCFNGEVGECFGLTPSRGGEGDLLSLNFNLFLDALVVCGDSGDNVDLTTVSGDNGGLVLDTFCVHDVNLNLDLSVVGDNALGDGLVGDVALPDL